MSSMFYVLLKNQALENNYEVIFREPDTRWKFNVQELARYFFVFLAPHYVSCYFQVFQTEQKNLFRLEMDMVVFRPEMVILGNW